MSNSPTRILLLDDDYASMQPLQNFLVELHGYSVELTASHDVLARLAHERFDLLCVDIMIHHSSRDEAGNETQNVHFEDVNWQKTGIEFFKRLRRGDYAGEPGVGTPVDVPVIFLSAVAEFSIEDVLSENTDHMDYLEKPFDVEEFVDRVEQLLHKVNAG